MKKLFFIGAILFGIQFQMIAQDCNFTVKGKVLDFHNNSPIMGASIQVLNTSKYTTTTTDGYFEIKNLCGKVTLELKHIACETKVVTLTVSKDLVKTIFLEHHLEELNEVVVTSSVKSEITSIEKSISKAKIDNFSDKSLGDALTTISGVGSLNTGNSIVKPIIQGLHSSRLLIINNNVRLFDQEWGDEHAPNIDINSSGKINVIKGANTLKYGSDAIGGLILIEPNRFERKDSIFGSTLTSFNTNGRGGILNSEIVKTYSSGFYTKFQANYRRFGDFKAPNYFLTNTGLESINTSFSIGNRNYEKGYSAYYSYVNNEFGILQASHIGNVNDLVVALNNDEPTVQEPFGYQIGFPKQSIVHHLGKVDAYKRIQNFGKISAQYDFQINRRKEFDLRRGNLRDRPVIDLRLFTTSFQTDLEIDYFENLEINTGILLRYQQNDAVAGTGASPLIPDFEKYDFGIYATTNFELNESSEFSAGIRYDFSKIDALKRYNLTDWNETYNYDELFPEFETGTVGATSILINPRFNFHNISTSLGYSKNFEGGYSLLVNYGLASRMPNPSEFFSDGLHHSAARIETGLLTLDKEIANKFGVSLERANENFGFSINPYFKSISGFIQLIPTGITTTIRGAFPVWEYNQVNALIYGIDLDLNAKISEFFYYEGNLSLLRGENSTENIPLINMPAANFSNKLSYKNSALNDLTLSITQRTVFQQNRFPDYNFFTFNPVTQQNIFVDLSSTPPTYSLFGFQSSMTLKPFKKGSMNVALNVDNLFNISYREHLNRFRFFADELGRNINVKLKLIY